jgi:Caspase domain
MSAISNLGGVACGGEAMKRLTTILCGLWAAFVLCAGPAQAEKRVALVIGNSDYQNASKLANPVNDAKAMAEMFRRSGFEVVEAKTDLGNLEFKRVAREFTAIARDADIAVMYFAGHGIEVNGTNYLLPVDAKLASDFDVEDEALSLDRLARALEPAKRLRLIILDACRDNPFVRTMQRGVTTRQVTSGLAKIEPTTSDTLIAFAAKAGSTAEDGRGSNSPFTAALVKNLSVPGRDIRIALGYVRDEVVRATGNKQEPFVYGSLGGATVALVPEVKREIAVQQAAPVGADPRRDYEFAERVGTKEAWDSFLAVHKSGFYANLARSQREKVARDEAPVVPQVPPTPKVSPAQQAQPKLQPQQNIAVLPGSGTPTAPDITAKPAIAPQASVTPPAEAFKPPPAESKSVVAVLPPPDAAKREIEVRPDLKGELRVVTRTLQTELRRVGCDPGGVDGIWSPKSRDALGQFNRHARMNLDTDAATVGALDAVKAQRGRICPLVCGGNQQEQGGRCVAIPAKPQLKKEAVRPPEPTPRERARERLRERADKARERVRGRDENVSRRPAAARSACPAGSTPMPQGGGRMCCETTPVDRGAPRIFCP